MFECSKKETASGRLRLGVVGLLVSSWCSGFVVGWDEIAADMSEQFAVQRRAGIDAGGTICLSGRVLRTRAKMPIVFPNDYFHGSS
jgi:hypothetical protein